MAQKWYQKATVQTAIVTGVFLIGASLVGIIPSLLEPDNTTSPKNRYLFINYARLFGGFQVPFFLSGYKAECVEDVDLGYILGDTGRDFWEKWEYKNAKPIKSLVWDELFRCHGVVRTWSNDSSFSMIRIANEADPETRPAFYYSSNTSPYEWEEPTPVEKGAPKTYWDFMMGGDISRDTYNKIAKNSKKIGFLLLLLENESNSTLFDIDLEYKVYENFSAYPNLPEFNIVEQYFSKAKILKKRLPRLRPKEQLLWLISVYMRNKEGYPKTYISSVIRPIRATYSTQERNGKQIQKFRLPLREKAVKIDIPFGWYWQ